MKKMRIGCPVHRKNLRLWYLFGKPVPLCCYYTADAWSTSTSTNSVTEICVASNFTLAVIPAWCASIHRPRQRHQKSPSTRPGKWYSGMGVDKSFPCSALNLRNSSFTWTQMVCIPRSSAHVSHVPVLKNPVMGDSLQAINSEPSTLSAMD